jgi:hypothetical protein
MNSSHRELGERKAGTRDFESHATLTPLGQTTGTSEAESDAESLDGRCASLYDAIRDMSAYASELQAEKRRSNGPGVLRNT